MDKFHHKKKHAIHFTKVVDPDQIGVVEAGHGFGLCFKRGPERGVFTEFAREDLDGDRAVERDLACLVNGSHTPLRNEILDLVSWEKRL